VSPMLTRPAREGRTPRQVDDPVHTRPRMSRDRKGFRSSSAGGRLTLEQRLEGVWEGLRTAGTVECPVCHGELSSAATGMQARCARCGSTIS